MFDHPDFDAHEQVVFAADPAAGLRAIVALHSTALGPAFGGCRMWPYPSGAEALTDALRLARGMTYKAAICDLPYGGGKSVIIGDPRRAKTPALLRAMGRAVEALGGRYIVADDIGTTLDDLVVMREVTAHTAAATTAARAPLAVTAYGVLMAIRAAVRQATGRDRLEGLRVAIQGLGNVGRPLAGYLHEAGAELIVADLDPARVAQAVRELGAQAVEPEAVYDQRGRSVRALRARRGAQRPDHPAASGADRLRRRQQPAGAPRHADTLAERGILYVPDYLANAGGVIDFHQERIDDSSDAVLAAVGRIEGIAAEVLGAAARTGQTPQAVADQKVQARLQAARRGPG